MDKIRETIMHDIQALENLSVVGANNCYIVVAISNDLKRIYNELEKHVEKEESKE